MEEIALTGSSAGLKTREFWSQLIGGAGQGALVAVLGRSIVSRRWYGAKSRTIRSLAILDAVPLSAETRLVLLDLQFTAGQGEVYQVPLVLAAGERAKELLAEPSASLWARVQLGDSSEPAALFDALEDATCQRELLRLLETSVRIPGAAGELVGWQAARFGHLHGGSESSLVPRVLRSEQSNSSIVYGDRLILKLFRRVETGLNPDVEITARLTEGGFAHVPPLAGGLDYRGVGHEPWTLAMAQGFVPNQGDGWRHTLRALGPFLQRRVQATSTRSDVPQVPTTGLSSAAERQIPAAVSSTFGEFLIHAERLGTRTAQMHLELAADTVDLAFVPEPFSEADGRSFAARASTLARETFELLRDQIPNLPPEVRHGTAPLLAQEPVVHERFDRLASEPVHASKIRCHGDYHLGQVLVSGDDYFIIDFEGEPARPLSERRNKQLAMRDVAGMIRSYHYASCSAARECLSKSPHAERELIERWSASWYFWTSVAFLAAYRRIAANASFLPTSGLELQRLLDACLLEKAIYELRYELNNRPQWVYLPLQALRETLGGGV